VRSPGWGRQIELPLAAVLILLGGYLALEQDGKNGFWADNPFLAGLAGSALTLVATVLIVDRFLSWRSNRRWRRIARVAYRGVARSTRDISHELAALYCDPDLTPGSTMPGGIRGPRDIQPIEGIRQLPAGKGELGVWKTRDLPSHWPPLDDVIPRARLLALSCDRAWCESAAHHIGQLVDANRRAIQQWGPLMLAADEPRDVLDAVASLNDELYAVAVTLRRLWDESIATSAADHAEAIMLWRIVDAKSRILTNAMWSAANEASYSIYLPGEVRTIPYRRACREVFRLPEWSLTEGYAPSRDLYAP